MLHGHDERAARLVAYTLRLGGPGAWRDVTDPLDGIGFVASFIGRLESLIDEDTRFRVALGHLLLKAVDVESSIDRMFAAAAGRDDAKARGWVNDDYCKLWGGPPTRADYERWLSLRPGDCDVDLESPFVSYEHFAGLERVRPGIKDSEVAKRRVGCRGKDRHAADMEGDGDTCNKAF